MKNFASIFLAALFVFGLATQASAQEKKVKKETTSVEDSPMHKQEKKAFIREYGMAGCGLGSVLLGKRGAQIFAATTNGTVSNQLFGITSGTLNCIDEATSDVASRSDYYIRANRYALESDVARGSGETLAGLSQVLGCQSGAALGAELQKQYQDIFTKDSVSNEVTDSIITVIINSPDLASQCHLS
jgi:hypothetical protein